MYINVYLCVTVCASVFPLNQLARRLQVQVLAVVCSFRRPEQLRMHGDRLKFPIVRLIAQIGRWMHRSAKACLETSDSDSCYWRFSLSKHKRSWNYLHQSSGSFVW